MREHVQCEVQLGSRAPMMADGNTGTPRATTQSLCPRSVLPVPCAYLHWRLATGMAGLHALGQRAKVIPFEALILPEIGSIPFFFCRGIYSQ
jgi:hypothetical protein